MLGDWIVEDIFDSKRKIISKEDFRLGINENQMKIIKKLAKKNKNFKEVLVKDGIAFLPPMFIGFLIIMLI